jgi:hypothetical protein
LIGGSVDPFKLDEPDPLKTDAIFSSAWELVGLRSHYLASISTLFKVFQESFDKPKYDLEDFLDHSYSTVCLFFSFCVRESNRLEKPDMFFGKIDSVSG